MHSKRRLLLGLTSLFAVLCLSAVFPTAALADQGPIGSNSMGWDISWPQCGKSLPDQRGDMFHVVGVTGGRPYTTNPCLSSEFDYANAAGPLSLYVNLDFSLATAGGPLTCNGDAGCEAYNYGWGAGVSSWYTALDQTNGASADVQLWWLDVETENYWSDNTDLNTYVIQGALDFLRLHNRTVGIYSTNFQWQIIAGDSYAPPGTPNWVAGASSIEDGRQCHNPLWDGGVVWAYQYLDIELDLDLNRGC